MKFAAALQKCAVFSPLIADVHATYKAAKKLLKTKDSCKLSALIADKVVQWNDHYLDTEEDLVIECADLQEVCGDFDSEDKTAQGELLQDLVNFHGRLILFLHWCLLAHTAVIKLLKKCNKKLGTTLVQPNVQAIIADSCCSTDVTSELLATIEGLITKHGASLGITCRPSPAVPSGIAPILLQGCCTNRTTESIKQAVASFQAQLHDEHMMTDDEPTAGPLSALQDEKNAATGPSERCEAGSSSAASGSGQPAVDPVADRSIIQQLQAALKIWEDLKNNARTPSTVLRCPLVASTASAPQSSSAGSAVIIPQCSCN